MCVCVCVCVCRYVLYKKWLVFFSSINNTLQLTPTTNKIQNSLSAIASLQLYSILLSIVFYILLMKHVIHDLERVYKEQSIRAVTYIVLKAYDPLKGHITTLYGFTLTSPHGRENNNIVNLCVVTISMNSSIVRSVTKRHHFN